MTALDQPASSYLVDVLVQVLLVRLLLLAEEQLRIATAALRKSRGKSLDSMPPQPRSHGCASPQGCDDES